MKLIHVVAPAFASLCAALAVQAQTARPLPKPASPAETAKWREQGRTLPTPELLQPTLDPALPAFTPRTDIEIAGHFKGAASDVLAALTKNWFAAFQKFYPKVSFDLPPPYAGSLGAVELAKGGLDFVMVSRELRPTDITEFRKNFSYDPTSLPIAGGTYRHFGFLDALGGRAVEARHELIDLGSGHGPADFEAHLLHIRLKFRIFQDPNFRMFELLTDLSL